MNSNLSLEELKGLVQRNLIDTVITAIPDMQGRLMGKRFEAHFFLENAVEETHCCNYLIATDMEMNTIDGFQSSGWSEGYGDYVMKPDLETLKVLPWLEKTAFVLCDLLDHDTHELVPHAPRTILKKQLKRLEKFGLKTLSATELEFFIFNETYEACRELDYRGMTTSSPYNEDYHLFRTLMEEDLMKKIRNGLYGAGIKVESTKGEASAGQGEINVYREDMLSMADSHVLIKHGIKEMAYQCGKSVTFMAKWNKNLCGSSGHIHQSLLKTDGSSAFHDPDKKYGMSDLMKQYLAGLLTYSEDITFFLAPYVNSYKRFASGSFAPTKIIWSADNRTAGYRIAGAGTKGVRVECRIGGSDLNPYLALAGQLAAGIKGMEEKLTLEPEFKGNAYIDDTVPQIPKTLRQAKEKFTGSEMLRNALGEKVHNHYSRVAEWELEDFYAAVTDYEIRRGFERS